ncbi:MAG: PEGA domain-containing protein [Nanoarchaeota archaeon]
MKKTLFLVGMSMLVAMLVLSMVAAVQTQQKTYWYNTYFSNKYNKSMNKPVPTQAMTGHAVFAVGSSMFPTKVNVVTVPPDATLYIDDRVVGNTPMITEVDPGLHKVTIKKAGYVPFEAKYRFLLRDTARIKVKLTQFKAKQAVAD